MPACWPWATRSTSVPTSRASPSRCPTTACWSTWSSPGSNAATHGLKPGDVLLAYNGQALNKKDDLKVVAEGDKPIAVEVWRDGRSSRRDLAPGKLGVVLDPRPAPDAIAANRRKLQQGARGGAVGRRGLRPLAGHAIRGRGARPALQVRRSARPGPCSGPTRASPSSTAWPPRASWGGSASSTWRRTG